MANDGSIASRMEEWIADQLRALPEFDGKTVEPWEGSADSEGKTLVEELISKQSPYAAVLFEGDRAVELEEGEVAYLPTYGIYTVVRNSRPGAARKGDGTEIGTNGLRDLIRVALHDKAPVIFDDHYHTERTEFRGSRIVFQRRDAFIQRSEIVCRESPKA